jgi:hypothetical protein
MDPSETNELAARGGKPKASKGKPAPAGEVGPDDPKGHLISEMDGVTAVTERETNKVMDQLDVISSLVGTQQALITGVMRHPGAQDPSVQEAVNQVMAAGKDIQNKVYEAMDLMQFQDITRQKLERIVHHLRQIHDYIVDLLGTGLKSDAERATIGRTIASTGTVPDEKRVHADSAVEEFKRGKPGKGKD